MPATTEPRRRTLGRLASIGAIAMALVLATASVVDAALVAGSLPGAGFTFLSTTENAVLMTGDGIHMKTKGPVTVKTTYSIVAPGDALIGGWHYHNGPVVVTVANGTLTLYDSTCGSWDIATGQSYIESTGQVLVAKALASKNPGTGASVQWFTTRLYPEGAIDPVNVAAPCTP
jgi:hypothetical protein